MEEGLRERDCYVQGGTFERLFWQQYEEGSMSIVESDELVWVWSDTGPNYNCRNEITWKKKHDSSFAGQMERIVVMVVGVRDSVIRMSLAQEFFSDFWVCSLDASVGIVTFYGFILIFCPPLLWFMSSNWGNRYSPVSYIKVQNCSHPESYSWSSWRGEGEPCFS